MSHHGCEGSRDSEDPYDQLATQCQKLRAERDALAAKILEAAMAIADEWSMRLAEVERERDRLQAAVAAAKAPYRIIAAAKAAGEEHHGS